MDIDAETSNNQRLNWSNLTKLFPRTYYLIVNLHSVYFFEYVIITAFADTMGLKMKKKYGDGSLAI